MKYRVLQIVVMTEFDPRLTIHREVSLGYKFFKQEYLTSYEHVADVEADGEEDAFRLLNLFDDESLINRRKPMHSLSVGDILIDDNGVYLFCDSFGFRPFWIN